MGIKTGIEYCDSTINPIMGCNGCELYDENMDRNHCYAHVLCHRYAGLRGWPSAFTDVTHFPGRLVQAASWPDLTGTERPEKPWLNGYPRVIFVNDLGDGFCPDADPKEWLLPALGIMEASPHIYLLLTKWPRRMADFFVEHGPAPDNLVLGTSILSPDQSPRLGWIIYMAWENLGTHFWISCEPLLGLVDLADMYRDFGPAIKRMRASAQTLWMAAGGESGHNARPTKLVWAHSLQMQCGIAGIPFFWKQWGEWVPQDYGKMVWVGKKDAGRLIDGREHSEMGRWLNT